MFFQLKSYLNFILNSTNQHGIHSPFVFNLITKCFYDNYNYNDYTILKKYRLDLLTNQQIIEVADFGAGSKKFKDNMRKISLIAKNAGISKKRGHLLYKIVKYFNSKNVLEIGTSLGIATSSISLANSKANITTIEGCTNTAEIAQYQFKKFNLKNILVRVGEFEQTLNNVLKNNTFDLIYFDGNHQKKATIDYFEQCLEHINNDSIFIFDDIYWSKDMHEAWEYIRKHTKVTVSIDTFQWGIVFFRKEQPKQHFTIRV